MGANAIEIYRKKSKTIICTVTGLADLDGYTGILIAKVNKSDTTAVITKTGSITGLVITFVLTPTLTDVADNIYHYDIVITNPPEGEEDPLEYTIVQDILEIKKSVSD